MNIPLSTLKIRYMTIWVLVGSIVFGLVLQLPFWNDFILLTRLEIMLVVSLYLIPILWFYINTKKLGVNFYASFFSKPSVLPIKTMIATVIMPLILGAGLLVLLLVIVMSFNAGLLDITTESAPVVTKDLSALLVGSIITGFIAPMVEEIVFRGYLLWRLNFKLGIKKAIIISSIIFGVLHLQNVFGATIFGIAMCLLYIRTQSLIVPIAVHMISNLLVVAKDIVLFMSPSELSNSSTSDSDILPGLIVSFLLIGIGLLWLIPFLKRNWGICTEMGIPGLIYKPSIQNKINN